MLRVDHVSKSYDGNLALNDVSFVDYHQFRAEARLLFGSDVGDPEPPAPHK